MLILNTLRILLKARFWMLGFILLLTAAIRLPAQNPASGNFSVIAYYHGNEKDIERYSFDKLTHVIYSFLHLNGNKLTVNPHDSITIVKLVELKKKNPTLKVLVSLGGWGGCPTCPEVFSTNRGRSEFSNSVKEILEKFHADGIDLDWEYPAIESIPGYAYSPDDKPNFTRLIQNLREVLGENYEISFAAGAFKDFLEKSVEWHKVMPLLNYVNLMTYDFVNGYSTSTGHLTPLYSSGGQVESTDRTVRYLDSIGVPRSKMIIGAAFYARLFSDVDTVDQGLFRPGKFSGYVNYYDFDTFFAPEKGFTRYFDEQASAPYSYNPRTKTFATYDNPESVAAKTNYALRNGLGGIMFWSLRGDKPDGGLLDAIHQAVKQQR